MIRFLLFLLFPAIELFLLVKVGAKTGAFAMALWVFASAMFGIWAIRRGGRGALERLRLEIAEGRAPQSAVLDGLMVFVAGIFLILPGLITDALGMLLLIPCIRHPFMSGAGRRMANAAAKASRGGSGYSRIFVYSNPSPRAADAFDACGGTRTPFRAPSREDGEHPRRAVVIDSSAVEIRPEKKD